MSDLAITIISHTKNYVAVDKPAGVSVHNLEDGIHLLALLQRQLKMDSLFPVHRLDKETSGVQILAFNPQAARELAEEFQQRTVKKIYVGVVRGQIKPLEGAWKAPLTDKAEGRKNPAGFSKERIPCETHYRVLKASIYFSLCEFNLFTGRQHQIRKHCALARHALVGDSRYGDSKYNKKMAELYKNDRMFLHCQQIQIGGESLEARLPSGFEDLLR